MKLERMISTMTQDLIPQFWSVSYYLRVNQFLSILIAIDREECSPQQLTQPLSAPAGILSDPASGLLRSRRYAPPPDECNSRSFIMHSPERYADTFEPPPEAQTSASAALCGIQTARESSESYIAEGKNYGYSFCSIHKISIASIRNLRVFMLIHKLSAIPRTI